MKKIINGKMYNTETARQVGSWWNGYSVSDFNYCKETLYRKKTGEYFLYGEGEGLSKFARHYVAGWGHGEEIIPLTEAGAMRWAEQKLDPDEYIAEFGEPEE